MVLNFIRFFSIFDSELDRWKVQFWSLLLQILILFYFLKTIRRGIVTLKVRRNSPGAPSLSTFTTPRSSPGSSRRNSKDVTAESSSSSNSSSPTMFRKLRQRRNKKQKSIELVLYKGVTIKPMNMTIVILLLVQYPWHFIITQFKAVTVFDDFLVIPFFSLSPLNK